MLGLKFFMNNFRSNHKIFIYKRCPLIVHTDIRIRGRTVKMRGSFLSFLLLCLFLAQSMARYRKFIFFLLKHKSKLDFLKECQKLRSRTS